MKARINQTHNNKYTDVCALVGHFDESGNYCEAILKDLKLEALDISIRENIDFDHDITLHVAPRTEVRVFAKNLEDLLAYYEIIKDDGFLIFLLNDFIKCTEPTEQYIWTSFNIENCLH